MRWALLICLSLGHAWAAVSGALVGARQGMVWTPQGAWRVQAQLSPITTASGPLIGLRGACLTTLGLLAWDEGSLYSLAGPPLPLLTTQGVPLGGVRGVTSGPLGPVAWTAQGVWGISFQCVEWKDQAGRPVAGVVGACAVGDRVMGWTPERVYQLGPVCLEMRGPTGQSLGGVRGVVEAGGAPVAWSEEGVYLLGFTSVQALLPGGVPLTGVRGLVSWQGQGVAWTDSAAWRVGAVCNEVRGPAGERLRGIKGMVAAADGIVAWSDTATWKVGAQAIRYLAPDGQPLAGVEGVAVGQRDVVAWTSEGVFRLAHTVTEYTSPGGERVGGIRGAVWANGFWAAWGSSGAWVLSGQALRCMTPDGAPLESVLGVLVGSDVAGTSRVLAFCRRGVFSLTSQGSAIPLPTPEGDLVMVDGEEEVVATLLSLSPLDSDTSGFGASACVTGPPRAWAHSVGGAQASSGTRGSFVTVAGSSDAHGLVLRFDQADPVCLDGGASCLWVGFGGASAPAQPPQPRVRVVPSPWRRGFSVDLDGADQRLVLSLYDLGGRLAGRWTAMNRTWVEAGEVAPGPYLLRVEARGVVQTLPTLRLP